MQRGVSELAGDGPAGCTSLRHVRQAWPGRGPLLARAAAIARKLLQERLPPALKRAQRDVHFRAGCRRRCGPTSKLTSDRGRACYRIPWVPLEGYNAAEARK